MVENLPCEFRPFHYVRGNRNGLRAGSSLGAQEMTDADAFPLPPRRRRGPLGSQSGYLVTGAHPEHAAAVGARHRPLRVRSGADDREQGRQGALPDAADASAPVAPAALIPVPPKVPQAKENRHDPSLNIPE